MCGTSGKAARTRGEEKEAAKPEGLAAAKFEESPNRRALSHESVTNPFQLANEQQTKVPERAASNPRRPAGGVRARRQPGQASSSGDGGNAAVEPGITLWSRGEALPDNGKGSASSGGMP